MDHPEQALVRQAYDLVERLESERRRLYAVLQSATTRGSPGARTEAVFRRTARLLTLATRARARHQRRMHAERAAGGRTRG